jgi:hypothetical protein
LTKGISNKPSDASSVASHQSQRSERSRSSRHSRNPTVQTEVDGLSRRSSSSSDSYRSAPHSFDATTMLSSSAYGSRSSIPSSTPSSFHSFQPSNSSAGQSFQSQVARSTASSASPSSYNSQPHYDTATKLSSFADGSSRSSLTRPSQMGAPSVLGPSVRDNVSRQPSTSSAGASDDSELLYASMSSRSSLNRSNSSLSRYSGLERATQTASFDASASPRDADARLNASLTTSVMNPGGYAPQSLSPYSGSSDRSERNSAASSWANSENNLREQWENKGNVSKPDTRDWSRGSRTSAQSVASSATESDALAETLAGMNLAQTQPRTAQDSQRGSSSAARRPYSLVSKPPVVEITRSSFEKKAKSFHGKEISEISSNPEEYSSYISSKSERTAELAKRLGSTESDSKDARYFSYQLGKKSAGLLRTERGFTLSDQFESFELENWQNKLPGRTEITSAVDLRITHPLVENAGDILLEHQLRIDGEQPLLVSNPANPEARRRAASMGFIEVDNSHMVLDPTRHPEKWMKNSDGEWQRANKSKLYLAKDEGSTTSSAESAASSRVSSGDDDFM